MPKPIQSTNYSFRAIIENGFIYVDKTQYLYEIVRQGLGTYFVSRPRRFGKSLMVSTLGEIFRGNKELFQGLWIYDSDYEWESFPIIHLDLGLIDVTDVEELKSGLSTLFDEIATKYDLDLSGDNYLDRFRNLVYQLADKHSGEVVLLIDEYDKPIVNNLEHLDKAKKIRDTLRGFYGVVKALNHHWRFVFITGITKFSRVGVFSVMNNLDDLTMDRRFANALGITENELVYYFADYIDEFANTKSLTTGQALLQIRRWYDGFCFAPEGESLYNPHSTIQFFLKQRLYNYWFATGTPTFLIKLLQNKQYDITNLERVEADTVTFETFELDNLAIIPLLYQTGYLTIKDFEDDEFGTRLYLSYPNYEVQSAFVSYLLNAYAGTDMGTTTPNLGHLIRALRANDLDQFFETLNVFFANIDYDLHLKNEKYYQTIFYMIFLLLGLHVTAETKTSRGRIDAVVEVEQAIYIFEFKLDSTASAALQQTKDKEYAQKYLLRDKPITLVGANYGYEARKITEWTSETLLQNT